MQVPHIALELVLGKRVLQVQWGSHEERQMKYTSPAKMASDHNHPIIETPSSPSRMVSLDIQSVNVHPQPLSRAVGK